MPLSLKRQRDRQRLLHPGGAAVIGAHSSSPWTDSASLSAVVQPGVFPGLTLSGPLLWHGARLRRLWRGDRPGATRH